jgi:phenol 2-monooxygenase (NADPH)
MNVSMHDSYNLGWKLGSVINKVMPRRAILSTYESERRPIAQQLIDFDSRFAQMFSGRPAKGLADQAGISMHEFKSTFEKGNAFTSGISVRYSSSLIVDAGVAEVRETKQQHKLHGPRSGSKFSIDEANGALNHLRIGMRLPSHQVVRQCDARPFQLGDLLISNGSWRLLVFSGDLSSENNTPQARARKQQLQDLASRLSSPTDSIIGRLISAHSGAYWASAPTGVLEPILIHSSVRKSVEIDRDVPSVFYQPYRGDIHGVGRDARNGSQDQNLPQAGYGQVQQPSTTNDAPYDYDRVFADDTSYHQGHGEAYARYNISATHGCLVLVRPDQYVSWIGGLYGSRDDGQQEFTNSDRAGGEGADQLSQDSDALMSKEADWDIAGLERFLIGIFE